MTADRSGSGGARPRVRAPKIARRAERAAGEPQYWHTKRRRHWPGVLVMLLMLGLILGYVWSRWVSEQGFADVSISTWQCDTAIAADATAEAIEAAGCQPMAIGAEVDIMIGPGPQGEPVVQGPMSTFPQIATTDPRLALQVVLAEPAGAVLLADTRSGAPRPLRPLNPDASGTVWTQHFDLGDSARFGLLVSPPAQDR